MGPRTSQELASRIACVEVRDLGLVAMTTQARSPFDPNYREAFREPLLTADSLIEIQGRSQIDLDGPWRFHIDPYDSCRREVASAPRYLELLNLAEDEALRRTDADFPAGAWQTIRVPGCWNEERPELMDYEGCALYVREFDGLPSGPRYVLHVGAANYESTLWLNGAFLGRHEGGFTPFCVDVTAHLQARNVLAIVVDNRREADRVPTYRYDWFNYGGIFRSVRLVELPPSHIKRMFLRLLPGTSLRRLRLDADTSAPEGERLTLTVPALQVKESATVDKRGRASLEFTAEPRLWSPEGPYLYEIEVALESGDRLEDTVGFREVRVEGERLLLNGQAIFLRGISAHEEFPGRGRAAREEDTRQMLEAARDLGCNFVRLAHYPHHENAARLADNMGLLLWEEVPVYWDAAFGSPEVLANARNQLRELILRDHNRASVILWSVGNETPDTTERLAFLSGMAAYARELDSSRLVSAALLPPPNDSLISRLDIVAVNEYFGWYYGQVEQVEELLAKQALHGKPILVSEFGADCVAGLHGAADEIRTEEFQSDFYRRQFASILRLPSVVGTSPWVLYDFRSPLRQNKYQRGYNRKGLIGNDHRSRKQAFETVRQVYQDLADQVSRDAS
jgi:beta-glucuronidase